jgi:nucleoside-diphosphate-sugar epimerase
LPRGARPADAPTRSPTVGRAPEKYPALVTGCAGFIGSHLTESLLADGHAVIGVDCFNDNYRREDKRANLDRARQHDAFHLLCADLVEADLPALLERCDVVYHLAGEPGVRSSWGQRFDRYTHHNVSATQRLLEAARAVPGRRIVYASSSSVYGDALALPTREDAAPQPLSPYGVTKLAAEQMCELYRAEHGVDTVSLRYFSVYGPRQRPDMAFRRFCDAIVAGRPLEVFGDGRQTRDFTYVEDVVAATRAAGEGDASGVLNVGGGGGISVNRALELLAGIAGRPLDVRRGDRESGDVHHTGADITRARRRLGWRPRTGVEDGLAAEFAWALSASRAAPARRPGAACRSAAGTVGLTA